MKNITAISIPDSPDKPWRSLHVFNLYRLIMTGIIAVIFFFAGPGDTTLGADLPKVFTYSIIIWLIISLASGFASRLRWPNFQWQVAITILLDICIITLLMYSSGGMESGLGTLMLVTVAASGILLSGKKSFAFAALATLSVLAMHSYSVLLEQYHTAYGFTHIGLLGVGLFAVALLTHTLALRIRESEALALKRSAELADLSQVNELIIQQMDIGVLVVAHSEEILLQNDAAIRILNTDNNITGQPLTAISPILHKQLLSWKENSNTNLPPVRIEKSTHEVLPRFIRIGKTTSIATAIFLEDTAQLAHQSQQLKLASLGRLTASIAHEIRNPLSAINHASQLLAESSNFDKQDLRLTEIIESQAERLNTIVESILSLSRKEEYDQELIDLRAWLERFMDKYAGELHFKRSDVELKLESCDSKIRFDPTHLGQVLCNLCDNAFHHSDSAVTDHPRVTINCITNQQMGTMEIEVADNGPGVARENREKLFEPFFTTNPRGTGLGLFIARELSELNNAHLHYVDSAQPGTCFRLSIPISSNHQNQTHGVG